MPIASPEVYAEMLGRAKEHSFAFPAINCVGSESVNAAIKGFADAGAVRGKCGSSEVGENATSALRMIDQVSRPYGVSSVAAIDSGAPVMSMMDRKTVAASSNTASRDGP